MARKELQVEKREKTGNDNRKLRHQGIVPGVVYGPMTQAFNVQVSLHDLFNLLRHGEGDAELIDLKVIGEDNSRVVLLKDIQVEPISNDPIHIDFFEMNLNEPIDVDVSLEFVGEVKAVEEKRAELLEIIQELPIRVLPTQIPTHIDVDISSLSEAGDHLTIADIKLPEGVELRVSDPTELVVKVEELKEEVVEETPAEPTEAEAVEGTSSKAEEAETKTSNDKE